MSYALNASSDDHCQMCLDTGWVELVGDTVQFGVTYSRGSAPCKWCEWGRKRCTHMIELKQHPAMDFGPENVLVPDTDRTPFRPDAAFVREMERDFGTPREVLWRLYERVWPPEWPRLDGSGIVGAIERTETAADVERNRKTAQDALATLEGSVPKKRLATQQEAVQPPLSEDTPDYSDTPF